MAGNRLILARAWIGEMDGDLSLGAIRGIQIRVNWTWIGIFALLTFSLATGYFPQHFHHWPQSEYWIVGAVASILLFGTVLVHELSHSFVAQSRGLPVSTITLYIFGGISNLTREPASAGEEFWIAAAGPLSSIALGLIFLGLHALVSAPDWLSAIFGYLGAINLILALFNLIPAFPLDGGRIFRAAIWALTRDLRRGTRVASFVGDLFAWLFIGFGLWEMIRGNFFGGLWLAFIGWFLHNATTSSYRYAVQSVEFRNVDAADVMTRNPTTVDPETTLESIVQQHLLRPGTRAVPVVTDGRLAGLLTVSDVRHFTPEQWPVIKAWRAMTAGDKLDTVRPDTHLMDAMQLMTLHGHNQLPVVDDGSLVGLLNRRDVLAFIQTRHELGLDRRAPAASS